MKIITVTNQKGGVGKTATALNTAAELTRRGYKTLLIDLDPQKGNLSKTLRADLSLENMYEVLIKQAELMDVLQVTAVGDLATATGEMTTIAEKLNQNGGMGRERRLKEALETIPKGTYDFVIIDTPPALDILTMNALVATDFVVVTVEPDTNALAGMTSLNESIQGIQKYYNPNIRYAGVLLTKFRSQTNMSKTIQQLAEHLTKSEGMNTRLFDTKIRFSTAVPNATAQGKPVYMCDAKAGPAQDYASFVDELLKVISKKGGK